MTSWFFRGSIITDDGWSRKLVVLGLSLSYNWFNTCGVFWRLMKIIWQTNTLCYQTGSFFWYKNDLDFLALFSRLSINIFPQWNGQKVDTWSNHILPLKLSATSLSQLISKGSWSKWLLWKMIGEIKLSWWVYPCFYSPFVDICQNNKMAWGKNMKKYWKNKQFE